jgi:hypothetical protein
MKIIVIASVSLVGGNRVGMERGYVPGLGIRVASPIALRNSIQMDNRLRESSPHHRLGDEAVG